MSLEELRERLEDAIAGKSRSYVDDAIVFARALERLMRDYEAVTNNLTAVQVRGTELLTDRRVLTALIERIAAADPVERQALIAEALTTARAMR